MTPKGSKSSGKGAAGGGAGSAQGGGARGTLAASTASDKRVFIIPSSFTREEARKAYSELNTLILSDARCPSEIIIEHNQFSDFEIKQIIELLESKNIQKLKLTISKDEALSSMIAMLRSSESLRDIDITCGKGCGEEKIEEFRKAIAEKGSAFTSKLQIPRQALSLDLGGVAADDFVLQKKGAKGRVATPAVGGRAFAAALNEVRKDKKPAKKSVFTISGSLEGERLLSRMQELMGLIEDPEKCPSEITIENDNFSDDEIKSIIESLWKKNIKKLKFKVFTDEALDSLIDLIKKSTSLLQIDVTGENCTSKKVDDLRKAIAQKEIGNSNLNFTKIPSAKTGSVARAVLGVRAAVAAAAAAEVVSSSFSPLLNPVLPVATSERPKGVTPAAPAAVTSSSAGPLLNPVLPAATSERPKGVTPAAPAAVTSSSAGPLLNPALPAATSERPKGVTPAAPAAEEESLPEFSAIDAARARFSGRLKGGNAIPEKRVVHYYEFSEEDLTEIIPLIKNPERTIINLSKDLLDSEDTISILRAISENLNITDINLDIKIKNDAEFDELISVLSMNLGLPLKRVTISFDPLYQNLDKIKILFKGVLDLTKSKGKKVFFVIIGKASEEFKKRELDFEKLCTDYYKLGGLMEEFNTFFTKLYQINPNSYNLIFDDSARAKIFSIVKLYEGPDSDYNDLGICARRITTLIKNIEAQEKGIFKDIDIAPAIAGGGVGAGAGAGVGRVLEEFDSRATDAEKILRRIADDARIREVDYVPKITNDSEIDCLINIIQVKPLTKLHISLDPSYANLGKINSLFKAVLNSYKKNSVLIDFKVESNVAGISEKQGQFEYLVAKYKYLQGEIDLYNSGLSATKIEGGYSFVFNQAARQRVTESAELSRNSRQTGEMGTKEYKLGTCARRIISVMKDPRLLSYEATFDRAVINVGAPGASVYGANISSLGAGARG